MAQGISEYTSRSAVLLRAAEQFHDSLAKDEAEQDFALRDLLGAVNKDAAQGVMLGFAADRGGGERTPPSVSGGLSAVLFDLQSANLLIAAGFEKNELKVSDNAGLLHSAQQQIAITRNELLAPVAVPTGFVPALNLQSATLDTATQEFRKYSGQLLDEIVDEAEKTTQAALQGLAKLDRSEVAKALGQIGQAVPIVATVGNLVRKGLEKLKRAVEALAELFGRRV